MALSMVEAHAKIKAITGVFINNRIQAASADGRIFAVVNPYNKKASRESLCKKVMQKIYDAQLADKIRCKKRNLRWM